ncbi:putative phosphatase regulatory subunit-domain-containing protein [Xylaria sp. CBS 124048]|nr:putative phosphatase regulatory subunit-domain-containing protein [Xylaria sp. CBS 124048]
MPYTPPSHPSTASSAPVSPDGSRRSSFSSGTTTQTKPALPRSTSYLTKHRRSISTPTAAAVPSPHYGSTPDTSPLSAAGHELNAAKSASPSTNTQLMPNGASILSSESSSEDEGMAGLQEQVREIMKIKELKEAVSAIPQCRESSPTRNPAGNLFLFPSPVDRHMGSTMGTNALGIGRTVSHTRSHTDGRIYIPPLSDVLLSTSEDNSEQDESVKKPPMVRKKSGELVRPALRPASMRRPSSMPGTPTFTKAVHFDAQLEHVRHFLQVDKPLAVSANSSPIESYDSDTEDPFKVVRGSRASHGWEIVMNNFPAETPIRKGLPARLERVWMSPDQKSLMGSVSVANLAFQKSVVCRFTFDYWKTTSEVGAEYHQEIRQRDGEIGHDRFHFSIKLSDIANLEAKTLYLCIRYNVNGAEYWDNNDHSNFKVNFNTKRQVPNSKRSVQAPSSVPTNTSTAVRPWPIATGARGEFGQGSNLPKIDQPFLTKTEAPGLRLKISKSTTSLPSDNLLGRLSTPSGAAFANRYDFGASLSAAKQAWKSTNSSAQEDEGLYMKPHQRNSFNSAASLEDTSRPPIDETQIDSPPNQQPAGQPASTAAAPPNPRPTSPSPAPHISSASYEEIINKYCFFNGSPQEFGLKRKEDGSGNVGHHEGSRKSLSQTWDSITTSAPNGTLPRNASFYFDKAQLNTTAITPISSASLTESLLQSPKESDVSDEAMSDEGAYIATSSPNTASSGSMPNRAPQYFRFQRTAIQDHSPFSSHSATPISC